MSLFCKGLSEVVVLVLLMCSVRVFLTWRFSLIFLDFKCVYDSVGFVLFYDLDSHSVSIQLADMLY